MPELMGVAGTGSASIDLSQAAGWKTRAAGDGKVSVDTANFSTCLSDKGSARRSGGAEGAAGRPPDLMELLMAQTDAPVGGCAG